MTPLTERQRGVVIEVLRQGWTVSKAAFTARCTVPDIMAEQERNREFAEALVNAYETGTDSFEDVAARRAKFEGSDAMLKMMLMARRPRKFARLEEDDPSAMKPPKLREEDVIAHIEGLLAGLASREAASLGADEDSEPTAS